MTCGGLLNLFALSRSIQTIEPSHVTATKIVTHIKKIQKYGFVPTQTIVLYTGDITSWPKNKKLSIPTTFNQTS